MAARLQGDWLRAVRIYMVASAILHLVWELLQLPLYTIWRTGTAREIAFSVLHCTRWRQLRANSRRTAAAGTSSRHR